MASTSSVCLKKWSPLRSKVERPSTGTCNRTPSSPPVACRRLPQSTAGCLSNRNSRARSTAEGRAQLTARSQFGGCFGQRRQISALAAISGGLHCRIRGAGNGGRVQAEWLDSNAEVSCDVPLEECWEHWSDREKIPQWMPWISTVKVLEDKPDQSRWTLKYTAFDQDFKFSWIARNMAPVYHQKIHWRAVDGLANRGAVRFYKNRDGTCQIKMTISYEVPGVLAPFAKGVNPLVERIIQRDLERFVEYARSHRLRVPAAK